jgi:hypothetical protein
MISRKIFGGNKFLLLFARKEISKFYTKKITKVFNETNFYFGI